MCVRKRKGKQENFDMKPWLHELRISSIEGPDVCLLMHLTAGQHGNLRPESVLEALGLGENWAAIERTQLLFSEPDLADSP
jgi:hypothetical protein